MCPFILIFLVFCISNAKSPQFFHSQFPTSISLSVGNNLLPCLLSAWIYSRGSSLTGKASWHFIMPFLQVPHAMAAVGLLGFSIPPLARLFVFFKDLSRIACANIYILLN